MYQTIWKSFYNLLKHFKWNGEIVNKVFIRQNISIFIRQVHDKVYILLKLFMYLCKNKDLFLEVMRQSFQRSILCGELHLNRKDKPPRFLKMHCEINNHIEFSFIWHFLTSLNFKSIVNIYLKNLKFLSYHQLFSLI